MMLGPRFTAVILVLMLMVASLVLVLPEGSAASEEPTLVGARWKDAGINKAYVSGDNVLDYDRIVLLKFSIGELGAITNVSLSMNYTYATATGVLDVFAVDTSFDSTFATTTWTDEQISALCPEDGHVFQLTKGDGVLTGYGGTDDIWDEAEDYLYIGLALWNSGGTSKSYGIDIESVELTITHTPQEEPDGMVPYAVVGATGYISGSICYISGNTVLSYDRIMLLAYDLESEIGPNANISSIELALKYNSGPAKTSPMDVFAIAPFAFNESGWAAATFNDTFINAQCPEDEHAFQLWQSFGYLVGEGYDTTWQTQYDDDGFIYIGLAGWNFLTDSESYVMNMNALFLNVNYTTPLTWAPTITSSNGDDAVCFMDIYIREMSANESCTWTLETVTPPSGGNGNWLDIIAANGTVFGVPFPMCGPEGIGNYSVSVRADSIAGGLSAWQNFTLTVTSKRGGGNLYEPFGTFELVEQRPGLYGSGDDVQNATLTWDVSDTDLYYGGFDADALEGYGWELSTVAYVSDELVIILTHNDTERTYGVYGKDDLESLNGTAAIQILDARITIGDSTIYARATNINVTAYYFGLTGVKVNGVPYGLDISLPEYSNVTLEFTTTLDDVAASLGYNVFIYSITLNDGAGFYSWWGGGAANDSAIQFMLTDVYGEYGNTVGMWVTPEGNYTEKLAVATGTLRLTIREPYAPEITSTSMAPAYVREGYDFTFEAVDTDLFILQYPAPSWATWDNATGRFTGTPGVDDLGVYMIVVYPYNTTDGITGDPFYAQFIVRPAAEAGDGIGFFGYVFSSIIALLFCLFLSISRDGFNATVFMALVPMAIAVLISVGAMPLWTIMVGLLFYALLIFRNVGPGDSL